MDRGWFYGTRWKKLGKRFSGIDLALMEGNDSIEAKVRWKLPRTASKDLNQFFPAIWLDLKSRYFFFVQVIVKAYDFLSGNGLPVKDPGFCGDVACDRADPRLMLEIKFRGNDGRDQGDQKENNHHLYEGIAAIYPVCECPGNPFRCFSGKMLLHPITIYRALKCDNHRCSPVSELRPVSWKTGQIMNPLHIKKGLC